MATVIFEAPPRSRRRVLGRILWPILLVGAVVVAVVVSAAGQQTRSQLEYLDEMRSQAASLSRSGSTIAGIMSRIREIDREEFTTGFELIGDDLAVGQSFVANPPPTNSLIPVWSLYRQALQAWDNGVTALGAAVLLAADDPEDATVVNAVADALAEIRAGDALFRDLKAEFSRQEVPEPVSPLVDVQLRPADGGLASLAAGYVAAARSSTNALGLRPDLAVSQIVTDPIWQINVSGHPVIPATDTVVFSAVITNKGNVASAAETVSLTLNGGTEQVIAQMEVPALAPDGQATVVFDPVSVEPDTPYEVVMELVITNLDSDPDDNRLQVQFTVNSP